MRQKKFAPNFDEIISDGSRGCEAFVWEEAALNKVFRISEEDHFHLDQIARLVCYETFQSWGPEQLLGQAAWPDSVKS